VGIVIANAEDSVIGSFEIWEFSIGFGILFL
jgi:hypothetical protein